MLPVGRIHKTLKFIDEEYNKNLAHADRNRPIMYSKLGVLELCGWIEEGFDEIAINCVRSNLRSRESRSHLEYRISRTYGLSYEKLFTELLGFALGAVNFRRVEREFARSGNCQLLKDQLVELKRLRNDFAHTYTNIYRRGVTATFEAPSRTIKRFEIINPILQDLWKIVRQTN